MWLLRPGFSGFLDLFGPKIMPESINSLFFSLIAGNSVVEMGSIATASATTFPGFFEGVSARPALAPRTPHLSRIAFVPWLLRGNDAASLLADSASRAGNRSPFTNSRWNGIGAAMNRQV